MLSVVGAEAWWSTDGEFKEGDKFCDRVCGVFRLTGLHPAAKSAVGDDFGLTVGDDWLSAIVYNTILVTNL